LSNRGAYCSWSRWAVAKDSGPGRSHAMPQYVLILDAHAMDDFSDQDMPDID